MSSVGGPRIVKDGLVLYLDAGNIKSYSGDGNIWNGLLVTNLDATLYNDPILNNGSIVFDGVNDYADISSVDEFQVDTLTIDISTKILEPLNNSFKGFFSNIDGSLGYQLFWNGSAKHFYFYSSSTAISTSNGDFYDSGSILNLVCRFNVNDHTLNSIFLNGIDITNNRISSPLFRASNIPPRIGGPRGDSTSNYFLNQELYSVKFYNRILSNEEILQNYNATKSRFGL